MILSKGFWACVGTLIGALIGGVTSFLISKQTLKLELHKFRLPILLDRLKTLELIKTQYDVDYHNAIDADIANKIRNDYDYLYKKFLHLNHYFIDSSQYLEIKEDYKIISFELEKEIKEERTNDLLTVYQRDFNYKMDKLLTAELVSLQNEISKMYNKNK